MSLQKMAPFQETPISLRLLHSRGLLRVGGRLKFSNLDSRHLFLNHDFFPPFYVNIYTILGPTMYRLCGEEYFGNFHLDPLFVNTSKSLKPVSNCVRLPSYQKADLPFPRFNISRPFDTTDVDFAGLFMVRNTRLRKFGTIKG